MHPHQNTRTPVLLGWKNAATNVCITRTSGSNASRSEGAQNATLGTGFLRHRAGRSCSWIRRYRSCRSGNREAPVFRFPRAVLGRAVGRPRTARLSSSQHSLVDPRQHAPLLAGEDVSGHPPPPFLRKVEIEQNRGQSHSCMGTIFSLFRSVHYKKCWKEAFAEKGD